MDELRKFSNEYVRFGGKENGKTVRRNCLPLQRLMSPLRGFFWCLCSPDTYVSGYIMSPRWGWEAGGAHPTDGG